MKPVGTDDRFAAVDGLRTVAILWVAIYHYAYFWTPAGRGLDLVPYGDALTWIPLAEVGSLGVSLFFIVSGFVITMSLERCRGVLSFAFLRLLRLWPTLLACGTLTFAATTWLGPEELLRSPIEYAISLAFLPPQHVGAVLGLPDLQWLDGAYWSLWVEVRFYAIVAVLYFAVRARFLMAWFLFAAFCGLLHVAVLSPDHLLLGLLFTEHQPFFTMGIALAAWRHVGAQPLPVGLYLFGLAQAISYAKPDGAYLLGLALACGMATWVILTTRRVPILSARPMVRAGQGSYAYYLLHQNLGLALLGLVTTANAALGVAAMLVIQAAILVFSVWFTEAVEGPLRRRLRPLVSRRAQQPSQA